MVTRTELREDILEVLWDQYCKVLKFQAVNNQITVTMTFDEYLSLWTKHRVATIERKKNVSAKMLNSYLTGVFRPVCSWVSREARVIGGTMTVDKAKIRSADESKKLFQFKPGDKHNDKAKARIGDAKRGKAQSEEHVKKRTQGQIGVKRGPMSEEAKAKLRATRAANNAAKENNNG